MTANEETTEPAEPVRKFSAYFDIDRARAVGDTDKLLAVYLDTEEPPARRMAAADAGYALTGGAVWLDHRGQIGVELRAEEAGDPVDAPYSRIKVDEERRRRWNKYQAEVEFLAELAARESENAAIGQADLLTAELDPVETPEILYRTDGHALLYRGKVHNFVGETESGKSWVAAMAVVSEVRNGGTAVYYDYEDQARTFVRRLRVLGATDLDLARVHYYSVDRAWDKAPVELTDQWSPTIVVLDGVTEGMGVMGLDPTGTSDAQQWVSWVRKWTSSGACVITIDHVVKSKDGQGRWALGSQHKVSGIDGAHYVIEPDGVLRPGHESAIHIKVGKDRVGGVREFAGEMLDSRMQYAGRARFNVDGIAFEITLPAEAVAAAVSPADGDNAFQANLRKLLEEVGEASMTQIEKSVKGVATKRKRELVAQLHALGILAARAKGNGIVYRRDVAWTPAEASEDPAWEALWH